MLIKIGIICAAIIGSLVVLVVHEKNAPVVQQAPVPSVLRRPTADEQAVLNSMTSVAKPRKQEMH